MLSVDYVESPNLIDTQPLKSKPNYRDNYGTKKVPMSNDPSASGGGKRRKMEGCDESTTSELFPDSPTSSWESDSGSSADTEVVEREACELAEGMSRPACVSHGSVSVIGRRRTMEDAITVLPELGVGKEFSFMAVYDGHGSARVSKLCRDKMHQYLLDEMKRGDGDDDIEGGGEGEVTEYWGRVMGACFKKMDEKVVDSGTNDEDEDEDEVGSTASVAVVGKEVMVVANCGDSRVVLSRGMDSVPLSRDHKPDRPDEKERVEALGGRVTNQNGSRLCGVLTTSRSIGYKNLKPIVTSEPEVTVTKRTESDRFLVIATDGLWDVVSNEVACDIVGNFLSGKITKRSLEKSNDASEAAAKLAELAISKGSKDNISVIVVELNKCCRS